MTNRLYLIAYELVEWWKRYETPGPEGGLRRRLAEVVEKYERELKEKELPTAQDITKETARKISR